MSVLPQQRQALILRRIRLNGGARIGELVRDLGVSDMTVRRDLDVLARQGLIHKVHGGATAVVERTTDEPGFAAKSALQRAEKRAIAAEAAQLVGPGTAIGISAGTTTHALAQELLGVPELTVVTNSVPVGEAFYQQGRPDQTVILTGGIRTPSDALVGPIAVSALGSLHVDLVFMGVHGMDPRSGFTTPNLMESETDRALIGAARRLVVVADHTKWEMIGICSIARLEEADVLVSDAGLTPEAQEALSEQVGRLILASRDARQDSA